MKKLLLKTGPFLIAFLMFTICFVCVIWFSIELSEWVYTWSNTMKTFIGAAIGIPSGLIMAVSPIMIYIRLTEYRDNHFTY